MQQNQLLTRREAAAYLRVSLSTLDHQRSRGAGPSFVRIGGAVRYEPTALVSYLEAHRRGQM
ncbi:helix-turn-helix transcriptional regulator [Methylomonas rhizoryzae]|uniref:helix-turn-helix transcriptional regulator n=1 Tax=Methylomonas rhizoryzae TaxID=2608981 RepID=UPI001232C1DF